MHRSSLSPRNKPQRQISRTHPLNNGVVVSTGLLFCQEDSHFCEVGWCYCWRVWSSRCSVVLKLLVFGPYSQKWSKVALNTTIIISAWWTSEDWHLYVQNTYSCTCVFSSSVHPKTDNEVVDRSFSLEMLLFSAVYTWQQLKRLNRNFAKGSQCQNRLRDLKVRFHSDVFCCLIRTQVLFFSVSRQTGSIHETRQAAGRYTAPDRKHRAAQFVRLPSRHDKLLIYYVDTYVSIKAWIFLQNFESRYCNLPLVSWWQRVRKSSQTNRPRVHQERQATWQTGYITEGWWERIQLPNEISAASHLTALMSRLLGF